MTFQHFAKLHSCTRYRRPRPNGPYSIVYSADDKRSECSYLGTVHLSSARYCRYRFRFAFRALPLPSPAIAKRSVSWHSIYGPTSRSDIITLFSSSETRYKTTLSKSRQSRCHRTDFQYLPKCDRRNHRLLHELPSHALQRTAPTLTVVTSSPDCRRAPAFATR